MTMSFALEALCDFDGTVAPRDTVDLLLERLAEPAWRVLEERWVRGEIDSRTCMAGQVALIHGGWPAIERTLAGVRLDPTFAPFVHWCRHAGVRLRIVSGGIDRVIRHLLARDGIVVDGIWAARLGARADGRLTLRFPSPGRGWRCGAGFCKCALFTRAAARPVRVLIGDGRSDFCCAHRADLVFARAALYGYCRREAIPVRSFADFTDVRRSLERWLRLPRRPEGSRPTSPVAEAR